MALAGLAEVAQLRDQNTQSARLFGFAAKTASEIDFAGHTWKRVYQRQIADARARQSDPAYAAAWAEGEKLTLDEAKALTP